jgi:hypothetical protein
MDAQLEAQLIECLDALAQGESTERVLARYPQEAAQLRPLLEAAAGLSTLRMEPSEASKMQSRQKFMAQVDLLRRTTPRKSLGFLPRFAAGFIAAALVAGVLSTGAVAASGSALPGDPLYGLKRTVEEVRLNTAGSPTQRQELQREFEQRRVDEANELLAEGREGEVEFRGTIQVMQPNAWIVSSLVVQLDANTRIAGTPQIDRVAEVRGVTGPQGLRAAFISIESSGEPEMPPTPQVTETPQPTVTPEPAETTAPAMTITPQATKTQQPPAAPRPTATAQPAPTAQPVEVEFTGSVNAIDAGTWNIDGTTVIVNDSTEIRGTINLGQRVKVKALRLADGQLVATRIELSEGDGAAPDANGNDHQNSNDNQNGHDDNTNDGNDNGNDDHNSNSNDNGGDTNSNNGNDDHGGSKNENGD